jgi:hypothetical protein
MTPEEYTDQRDNLLKLRNRCTYDNKWISLNNKITELDYRYQRATRAKVDRDYSGITSLQLYGVV